MHRLGSMHEISWRARAGHGGGDLAADMTGFPDAADNDATPASQNQGDGLRERIAQPVGDFQHGSGFDGEDAAGKVKGV